MGRPSRLRLGSLLLALVTCLQLVGVTRGAIHADQAGVGDWIEKLTGTPRWSYFTTGAQHGETNRIIVGTEANVVASLDAATGTYVWRQVLEPQDELHLVKRGAAGGVLVVSGRHPTHVRLFNERNGALEWDTLITTALPSSAVEATFIGNDVVTVVGGDTVVRIDGDGEVTWKARLENGVSYSQVHAIGDVVYLVGTKKVGSTIHVHCTSLLATDGSIREDYQPPNSGVTDVADIFLTADADRAYLYWNGLGRSFRHLLGKKADVEELEDTYGKRDPKIVDVLNREGKHSVVVFKSEEKYFLARGADVLSGFEDAGKYSTFTSSVSHGGHAHSVIVRATGLDQNHVSLELFDATALEPLAKFKLDVAEARSGRIATVSASVTRKENDVTTVHAFVVTKDGNTRLFSSDGSGWTKPEALTKAPAAVFVDLPEKSGLSSVHDELDEKPEETASISPVERYIRRVRTHLARLKAAPEMVRSLLSLFEQANSTSQTKGRNHPVELRADRLGARKLIVFASETGKLLAVDTFVHQTPVWERYFAGVSFFQIENVRTSVVSYPPVIVATGKRGQETVVYRLDALTGQDYVGEARDKSHLPATYNKVKKVIRLPVEETDDRTHVLAFVRSDDQVEIYPKTEAAMNAFEEYLPAMHVYLTDGIGATHMDGFAVVRQQHGYYSLRPTWTINFPQGEAIAAIGSASADEHVASLGRVLGNRSVLFKYLNPNLITVATLKTTGSSPESPEFTSVVNLYLIDTISGSIHYRAEYRGAGNVSKDVSSIFLIQRENWAVLAYWNHGPDAAPLEPTPPTEEEAGTKKSSRRKKKNMTANPVQQLPNMKGFEVAVLEFYEGEKPDQRIESDVFSSYDAKKPHVISQSYVFPKQLTSLGVTTTTAGITTREILFGLAEGHLYGVTKRFLDPRRPVGTPSADDKEEGLIPYRPTLDFNPREVASYYQHVPRIEHILSAPIKLESTSLVVSWGLDVFCVKRSPSKVFDILDESFNYAALIATIVGLVVAIYFTKNMAQRKKLNDLWR